MSPELIIESANIPDKPDFYATTSHRFKKDVSDFFNNHSDKILVEFGTSRGYTSAYLSHFFKQVHTVNIAQETLAREYLSSFKNVFLYELDLYAPTTTESVKIIMPGDVYIIDAVHSYHHVISDTKLAMQEINENGYLIYDDYGAFPEVKAAIDDMVEQGLMEIVKYIGHEEGWCYGATNESARTLKHYEGVICKVL